MFRHTGEPAGAHKLAVLISRSLSHATVIERRTDRLSYLHYFPSSQGPHASLGLNLHPKLPTCSLSQIPEARSNE